MMALSLLPLAVAEGGGYLNVWKALPVLVILFLWARMLTWVDKDAEAAYLPREAINGSFMGGALLSFALFFILPNFWICLGVLLFFLLAEAGTYLIIRNKKVGLADLKQSLANSLKSKKKKGDHEAVAGE